MKRVIMEHPQGLQRLKPSSEVMEMIWQYQAQLLTCENKQAAQLISQKLNQLRRLVDDDEVNQK